MNKIYLCVGLGLVLFFVLVGVIVVLVVHTKQNEKSGFEILESPNTKYWERHSDPEDPLVDNPEDDAGGREAMLDFMNYSQ